MLNTYGLKLCGIKSACSYSRKGYHFELWYNEIIGKLQVVLPAQSEHVLVDNFMISNGFKYCGCVYHKKTMQELANQVYMRILQTRIF